MSKYVMYLAVLPSYRSECIRILKKELPELSLYVSAAHLDPSVRTGIDPTLYREVKMIRFGGKFFLQLGQWRSALAAETLVVDLNPRSVTAWLMLAFRRILRRRTLVWGHLHPQLGGRSTTAFLRRTMRKLSQGTITYTYENRAAALAEMPGQPVWTASNSLYRRDQIGTCSGAPPRIKFLYVGRFEPAKKVELLVEAFAASGLSKKGARLVLVGDGSQRTKLEHIVNERRLTDVVDFPGWEEDLGRLRSLYCEAIASCSPGFAGLGLTQSLGFGVPQIVAKSEPHSPEVELARFGGVIWCESNNIQDLARVMSEAWELRDMDRGDLSEPVRRLYSAETMATGLSSALLQVEEKIGE